MKPNGYYELSDVPRLMERGGIGNILRARTALMDAAEELLNTAASEHRALKGDEQRSFDLHAIQIREINTKLADHKRNRIEGCAQLGIPAELVRFAF